MILIMIMIFYSKQQDFPTALPQRTIRHLDHFEQVDLRVHLAVPQNLVDVANGDTKEEVHDDHTHEQDEGSRHEFPYWQGWEYR